jgi:GTP-sensing pleiotropic transcriptional regulator CodY
MTENELLEELAKELYIPSIEPDEITAQQLADRLGMGYHYIANQLKKKVTAGELTVRTVKMPDGKVSKAYRKPRG